MLNESLAYYKSLYLPRRGAVRQTDWEKLSPAQAGSNLAAMSVVGELAADSPAVVVE